MDPTDLVVLSLINEGDLLTLDSNFLYRTVSGDLPPPEIKMLYDSDHVIAEGPDAAHIGYIDFGDRMGFQFQSSSEDRNRKSIFVNLKESNISFAVDSFASDQSPNDPQDVETIAFCVLNTSEKLKHLIRRCEGKVRLRPLTDEELRQLQQYKVDQKGKSFIGENCTNQFN